MHAHISQGPEKNMEDIEVLALTEKKFSKMDCIWTKPLQDLGDQNVVKIIFLR